MNILLKASFLLVAMVLCCGFLNGAAFTAHSSDFLASAKLQMVRVFQAASTFTNFGSRNFSAEIFLEDCKKFSDRVVSSEVLKNIWNLTVTFHDDIEQQFEVSLQTIFGSEAFFLPRNVSSASPNLLSGILLALWLILGWSSISKMSYSKFFTFMSSLFLLNAVFGPHWCFRRFLFICALFSWVMAKAARNPVEAAGVVLVVFGLSLVGKWKDKLNGKKNTEAALANTKSLMEMMQNMDKKVESCLQKMDILISKMENDH